MGEAPKDLEGAVALLRAAPIPGAILEVARRLQAAGHAAVLVGGAVRDCLIGVASSDWDLATSATPDEVMASFRRTIPTGAAHGTVTVLAGGDEKIEVTTFRGESAYLDGRRPSAVTFLRDLHEDLARRDFTVNALAWDPHGQHFTDVHGGLEDLRAAVIRAVGDPVARFLEDGLRTMRAVRFCATLGFRLDPATKAAIPGALEVFDKVARERVAVELTKLLGATRPSLGLGPMWETGLWPRVLGGHDAAIAAEATAAVDAMSPDPTARLARILWPLRADADAVAAVLEGLRPSRELRATVTALVGAHAEALAAGRTPAQWRRAAAGLGRARLEPALELLAIRGPQAEAIRSACADAPLSARELALGGRALLEAGVAAPGPALGALLDALLDWVLEDPARNTADALLARARALAKGGSHR